MGVRRRHRYTQRVMLVHFHSRGLGDAVAVVRDDVDVEVVPALSKRS